MVPCRVVALQPAGNPIMMLISRRSQVYFVFCPQFLRVAAALGFRRGRPHSLLRRVRRSLHWEP